MKIISNTNFSFPNQKSVYHGKVRDVYNINDEILKSVLYVLLPYKNYS